MVVDLIPLPAAPVAPLSPLAPVAPVSPLGPCGPVAPVAPLGPCGPVAPVAPVFPALTLEILNVLVNVGFPLLVAVTVTEALSADNAVSVIAPDVAFTVPVHPVNVPLKVHPESSMAP